MNHSLSRCHTLALVLVFGVLAPFHLQATSYVMATDDELVGRADLIVVAEILSREAAPSDLSRPATDYLVEIEQLVKGFAPASTVVMRLLGGQSPDGRFLKVFGQPTFTPGERVILFLSSYREGTYRLVDMGLGAFRTRQIRGTSYALRDLSGMAEVAASADDLTRLRARSHLARREAEFLTWLSKASRGVAGEPDYFDETVRTRFLPPTSEFNITVSPSGCNASAGNITRWFEFARGQRINFFMHEPGQSGVPGGGIDQLRSAMQSWNSDRNSEINLRFAGTRNNDNGSVNADGVNMIVPDDPLNEIDGSFVRSGTLAIGTIFFESGEIPSRDPCPLQNFENGQAHPIVEAGIVTQDGAGENFFAVSANPELAFEEVIGHELGHTIGLSHSCGDDETGGCSGAAGQALMRATVFDDGRGARLGSDDRAAVEFLYPLQATVPQLPAAPSSLTATALSISQIQISWSDNSNNETRFEIEERLIDGGFVPIGTAPRNTTSMTIDGIPEASFRAYRVRAVNPDGTSPFSNEAGTTTRARIGDCPADASVLCLQEGRFEVSVAWETADASAGQGVATPISDDTGHFWFFDPANIEMVIKILDACGPPFERFWVFSGGLTDVEVTVTVIDRQGGTAKTYFNQLSTPFRPIQDTNAFDTCSI